MDGNTFAKAKTQMTIKLVNVKQELLSPCAGMHGPWKIGVARVFIMSCHTICIPTILNSAHHHPSRDSVKSHHTRRMFTSKHVSSNLHVPLEQQDDSQIDLLCVALSRFGHEEDTSRTTPEELKQFGERRKIGACMPQHAMSRGKSQLSYPIPTFKIDMA